MKDGEHKESHNINEELFEQKLNERMGHISSELAHDLRSPLQTIQNAIYLLQRNPDNEYLYTMVRESLSQATEILDNFRNYYKGHILQRIEVDLVKVIDLAFSELEISDNIALIREATDVSTINVDPSKMAIAIRNLLKNAIEAMPEGGTLIVEIIDEKNYVKIIISDTGVGLPSELNEIIYTPFMAERKNGRGLGIPTAKRIIESHGGELSYESEVGKGTIFTIKLPALR